MDLKGFLRDKKWKQMKKNQWLILFLAGVLLFVVAMPGGKQRSATSEQAEKNSESVQNRQITGTLQDEREYTAALEQRLAQILGGMDGVGDVQVMITVQDEGESVVEKDVALKQEVDAEADRNSENSGNNESSSRESSETTVFTQTDGDETPFVNKEILPEINGVLVVAQGGANAAVRKNISEAVEALFGLDAHKIKIVKMKSKGEPN